MTEPAIPRWVIPAALATVALALLVTAAVSPAALGWIFNVTSGRPLGAFTQVVVQAVVLAFLALVILGALVMWVREVWGDWRSQRRDARRIILIYSAVIVVVLAAVVYVLGL